MIDSDIQIDDAALVARLRALSQGLERPRRLMSRMAGVVEREIKDHFVDRDRDGKQSPKRQNWPRTHFWRREGEQRTHITSITDTEATVSVSSPAIAAHAHGATITPGPGKKALAIPLRPEVYGKRPSANPVPGMFVARWRGGDRAFLATSSGGRLTLWYALVRSVTIPRDPDTLPTNEHLTARLRQETIDYIAQL